LTLLWPIHRLRAQNFALDLAPRSLAGAASVSGVTQVVSSDAGIWKARLGNIIIKSRAEVLAFRALGALLEGRLNPILIPVCRAYQPVPDGAVAEGLYDEVPHSDDTYFEDDTGHEGVVIDVEAAASAAVRASSMTVTVNYAGEIQSGQHFSIGERLYRVRTFDEGTGALTFRPLLREAVTTGDRLNFDNPVGRFRLATDKEMDLELLGRRNAMPSVSFVEDL
jgi:hypothetical protein